MGSFQVMRNLNYERRLGDKGPAHEKTGRNESTVTRRGGRGAAGDGTTSRSMKALQFNSVSNAKERKQFVRSISKS